MDRVAVEAGWSPPVFRTVRAGVGTEAWEQPQKLAGRQSRGWMAQTHRT